MKSGDGLGLGLEGRVAVVTGGSRGIGRATALRLGQAGARLLINYVRGEAAARAVSEEVEAYGTRAHCVRADVSQASGAEALMREARSMFGRIDLLVCSAGVWEGAPLEEMSEELWDRVVDINLKGTWAACRAAVPALKEAGGGSIVIVSSTAGQRGEAGYANYAASKGGQISLAKSLAVELAPHHINVNVVAPGWVETQMCARVLSEPDTRRAIERTIPLGRVATPDDVALPILFLCSEWARHITGEVLNVNGGSVLCG